jgi:RNA-dependent RNA polymerase
MDLFMRGVALAATQDDVKVELAKILHKAPFPLEPLLNFDVTLFKNHNSRGKVGVLTLSNEDAGRTFLRSYGTAGVQVKGPRVFFSLSNRPLNEEKVAILKSRPWRDPQQLKMEKEQRIREGKPYPLKSYAFGRFLADGSFSSEFVAEGSADIACDLERRQVRFTLRKQSQRSQSDDDLVTLMLDLAMEPFNPSTIVSYPLRAIDSIVESSAAEEPIIFIRANTFPFFATETPAMNDVTDTRRSQGLVPDVPMPPGCFSLVCTFTDEGDKEAFIYAAQFRFHLRCVSKFAAIHVRDNISTRHDTSLDLDFLRDLPFELAFEVEKAIMNWTLTRVHVWSLRDELDSLRHTHGDAAAPIFRRFISLLEDKEANRQPKRKRRRGRNRAAPTTLESRLKYAVELYHEEQQRPRGRLAPALSPAVSYSYHMILTPTRHILEGPVADQSNSVLRRFKHHECFLRVSFQDENGSKLRRDLGTSITDLLAKRYRPILLNGCKVAGRLYHMLGYSMSGLKEHSLWFVTPFQDDQGGLLNAETIRESLVNAVWYPQTPPSSLTSSSTGKLLAFITPTCQTRSSLVAGILGY